MALLSRFPDWKPTEYMEEAEMVDMKKDAATAPVRNDLQHRDFPEKMKEACADFESLFLSYMLKTMRAGIAQSGASGQSHESGLMYSMLDEKLSEQIAESGGIGLGDMLYEKLIGQKQVAGMNNRRT